MNLSKKKTKTSSKLSFCSLLLFPVQPKKKVVLLSGSEHLFSEETSKKEEKCYAHTPIVCLSQNIQIIVLVTMEVDVFNLGQELISFKKTSV